MKEVLKRKAREPQSVMGLYWKRGSGKSRLHIRSQMTSGPVGHMFHPFQSRLLKKTRYVDNLKFGEKA